MDSANVLTTPDTQVNNEMKPPAAEEKDMSKTWVFNTYEKAVEAINEMRPKADGQIAALLDGLKAFFETRIAKHAERDSEDEHARGARIASSVRSRSSWKGKSNAESQPSGDYTKPLL